MKVLLVGWGYPPKIDGGLDIAVKELFQGLKKKNIDVDLVLPADRAPDIDNVIPVDVEGDMFAKSEQLSRKAASLAKNYDIVHTHDWFGVEAGYKASKYSEAKWVSSFHSVSSSRSRRPSEKIEKLEKIGVKDSDIATAVSNKLAEEIKSEHGIRPETVYNGFATAGKGPEISLDYESPVFFFVGRHAEQKGVEHLIYGFKKFLESHGKGTLVVGGDGHMRKSFEEFTEILELENHVEFEGFIPEKQLQNYYRAADIFVSPSINEPFGLTISEALNCGTKVVCTESGINELLPSESVTLVRSNSDSIKQGLEESLEKDFTEFSDRSWDEMVEDYLEIYKQLV